MKNSSKNIFLITNSKKESILFQINENDKIEYTLVNENFEPTEIINPFEPSVLKYAVSIDKSDKIHLVFLTKSGKLNYAIYENKKWSNSIIANFDLHSRIYGNIFILSDMKNMHILYAYANLINSEIWTIHHVVVNHKDFKQYNVAKFVSERSPLLFSVDMDSSGSIQLLYRSKVNDNYILYYTFYNPFTKRWNPTPEKLRISNSFKEYPYVLADTKNNIHALWIEKLDINFTIKYSRFTSTGNKKYMWSEIEIPYIDNCNNAPIIIEEKGVLKIIYSVTNGMGYLYSSDYGITWHKSNLDNSNAFEFNPIHICNAELNVDNTKIKDLYCSIKDKINFIFINCINTPDLKSTEDKLPDTKNDLEPSTKKQEFPGEINNKLNELLESQEELKDILVEILNSQNKLEANFIETIKTKKESFLDKFIK